MLYQLHEYKQVQILLQKYEMGILDGIFFLEEIVAFALLCS